MNPTLISFLGNPPPKPQGGERTYALAHYRFPGDTVVHPGHVFAGALLARLRASGDAPGRMLICGTLTSNWYALAIDSLDASDASATELMERLKRHTDSGSDTPAEDLLHLEQAMSTSLGLDVRMLPIGFCQTLAEQLEVVRWLSTHVDPSSQIVLDVTHGFRHLPLIGFAAAHYLELVRGCTVQAVFYGMFEAKVSDNTYSPPITVTPVVDLRGMLRIVQVGEGIAAHQASGLLGPLADVMTGELPELAEAAFFADIGMPDRARRSAGKALEAVGGSRSALVSVAIDSLQIGLNWSAATMTHDLRQSELAKKAAGSGNFVIAILLLWESLRWTACRFEKRNPTMVPDMEKSAHLEDLCTGTLSRPVDWDWWRDVRALRNALAHGAYQGKRRFVLDALTNRASMESAMNTAFDWAHDWRQYHEQRLGR